MKAGLLMGLESPSTRAERLARMLQIWGRVPTLEETVEKIDAVTPADVRDFADGTGARRPRGAGALRPGRGRADAGGAAETARRLMLRPRGKVRIETERMTLRPPAMPIFAPGRPCAATVADFLTPWEPTWAADHLSRKGFTNRVYWAQRVDLAAAPRCRCS